MPRKKERRTDRVTVPLAMPVELETKITDAARMVKLSKQDTMRLSLERGLAVLLEQLAAQPSAKAQVA